MRLLEQVAQCVRWRLHIDSFLRCIIGHRLRSGDKTRCACSWQAVQRWPRRSLAVSLGVCVLTLASGCEDGWPSDLGELTWLQGREGDNRAPSKTEATRPGADGADRGSETNKKAEVVATVDGKALTRGEVLDWAQEHGTSALQALRALEDNTLLVAEANRKSLTSHPAFQSAEKRKQVQALLGDLASAARHEFEAADDNEAAEEQKNLDEAPKADTGSAAGAKAGATKPTRGSSVRGSEAMHRRSNARGEGKEGDSSGQPTSSREPASSEDPASSRKSGTQVASDRVKRSAEGDRMLVAHQHQRLVNLINTASRRYAVTRASDLDTLLSLVHIE